MASWQLNGLNYSEKHPSIDGVKSNTSDSDDGDEKNGDSGVCRDFLRNVCRRGKRCKFRHPPRMDKNGHGLNRNDFVFCHDFQNGKCARSSCRFIHCTKSEEMHYKNTNELPPCVIERAVKSGSIIDLPPPKGEIPICKDFLFGDCLRKQCKFRHVQPYEYESEIYGCRRRERYIDVSDPYDVYGPPEPKRRHFDDVSNPEYLRMSVSSSRFRSPTPQQLSLDMKLLEDENRILKRQIDDLKKQVTDLIATNEFLLDQNARFRFSKQTGSVANVTTVTVPTVTLANTIAVPTSVTPVFQIAQNLPITSPQSSLNASPQMATRQVVGVPVSLSQPSTLDAAGSAGLTVSLSHESINHQALTASTVSLAAIAPPTQNIPVSISHQAISVPSVSMTPMVPPTQNLAASISRQEIPSVSMTPMGPPNQNMPPSISASGPLLTYPCASLTQGPALANSLSG